MIEGAFFRRSAGIVRCIVSGHAGYADPGADVVCAAVSSAVQTVANLMTEIYHLPVLVDEDAAAASITMRLEQEDKTGDAARLFEGLALQMQILSEMYPDYVAYTLSEV